MEKKLTDAEIDDTLQRLGHWRREGEWLCRSFAFDDFDQTMAFVNRIADQARASDHHPELIVGYRSCIVRYTTHSAGGLTRLDSRAASEADRAFEQKIK
jgi:4a-hydroxytetrahydrobiopterin dehydratase